MGEILRNVKKPKPKLNPNKKASELGVRPLIGLRSWVFILLLSAIHRLRTSRAVHGLHWFQGLWENPQAE